MKRTKWIGIAVVGFGGAVIGALSLRGGADDEGGGDARPKRRTTVEVVAARRGSVQTWIFTEGTVRSVHREYLTFESAGRVAHVASATDGGELREGSRVRAGQVLATQDQREATANLEAVQASLREVTTQVAVAEAELLQAKTDHDLAKATFQRFSTLLKQDSASQQEYDESQAKGAKAHAAVQQAGSRLIASRAQVEVAHTKVRQARVALERTELRSPIDGIAAYVNIEPGYYFTPGMVRTDSEQAALQTVPIVVIDPSSFELTVDVPAFERGRVQVSQLALLATHDQALKLEFTGAQALALGEEVEPRWKRWALRGEVYAVNPAVSPGGRAYAVKIRTNSGADQLEDGMFVTAWIAADHREDVVTVPANSLLYRNNEAFVFVVNRADMSTTLRAVKLGLRGFSLQEIHEGLQPGDELVTTGRYQLSDGAAVRVVSGARGSQ